ncbi:hypothetical protein [Sphingomonas sp.]|uniref:hypothetical protein n=1 Tax=Sphingomonas sp. TaxID=28214 RepID=UPI001D2F5958|nr:hypothetical protein [Sphingomonas sp.]MBX9796295.1 hypothetical protein [Sphingomonas sp.]
MQAHRLLVAGGLALGLCGSATGARKDAELIVRGDGIYDGRVNDAPARLRLTPWAPSAPTLNDDIVPKAGLHAGLFGFAVKVGPTKVRGNTSVARMSFGKYSYRRRVVWFDRRYDAGADGALGPGGLPAEVIRFELRPAQGGERTVALTMIENHFRPTYARVPMGKRNIIMLFDPQHETTVATAGAGAALAEVLGGQLSGAQGSAEVAFGIRRPVRTLKLERPLQIGPLSLTQVAVRIGDGGSVAGIKDADADPEEVVVSAKGGEDRRDVVIVGRDHLARCSSIVFDKKAKQIRLSCA